MPDAFFLLWLPIEKYSCRERTKLEVFQTGTVLGHVVVQAWLGEGDGEELVMKD